MKSQTGLYRPFSSRKWRKNPSSLALKAGIRWSSKPTTIAHERCHGRTSLNTEFSDSLLDELHREGATICIVTHDPRYADHAERTVHLFDGQIVDEDEAT